MARILSETYFKNRQEQAKIKLAITEAIPHGIMYHNLIIAITELLTRYVNSAYSDDVYKKPPEADEKVNAGELAYGGIVEKAED